MKRFLVDYDVVKLGQLMLAHKSQQKLFIFLLAFAVLIGLLTIKSFAQDKTGATPGNFGLPGIIDLPTAKKFPDGEVIITQQLHKSLSRAGISFQALLLLKVFSF